MKNKVAILYGPIGGNTEVVAKIIVDQIGENRSELIPVELADETTIEQFNKIIVGGATIGTHNWSDESSKKGWETFLPKLRKADLSGKTFAIFGLGDHIAYPDNFVDDIRLIYDAVIEQKGNVVGQCAVDDYTFNDSTALVNGKFVGLPIDQDHESDKTEERIKAWIEKLKPNF